MTGGDYDGVSIMWFRSVEDMQAMFADPAFAPVLEDGEQFLDLTATKQIVTFTEEAFAPASADDPDVLLAAVIEAVSGEPCPATTRT